MVDRALTLSGEFTVSDALTSAWRGFPGLARLLRGSFLPGRERMGMKTLRRLFTIKTKFEAFLAIYAIACTLAVFVAGGLMIDAVVLKQTYEA
jgi:hypothetical protein